MTRERFVKKLMGVGFSRNEANKISFKSRESGLSYREYYEYKCSWLIISNAMNKVGTSVKNFSNAMNIANRTMMSFTEAMRAVTQQDKEFNLDGCLIGHNEILSDVLGTDGGV